MLLEQFYTLLSPRILPQMASKKIPHCSHAFRLLCGGRPDRLGSAASPHSVLPPHITESTVEHLQGRHQAFSRDLGLSQPPQGVDQLTHPLDTAGEAVSGDPALRRAQTRQIALNFRNFRNLEVTSDAVRPVMAVYWGGEAMTLIVCHDCTCVASGSPVMHSFCGLLGPGTWPKCA